MIQPALRIPAPLLVAVLCLASALSCAGEPDRDAATGTPGAPTTEVPGQPTDPTGADPPTAEPTDSIGADTPTAEPPDPTGPDTPVVEPPDTTADPGPMIHPGRDPPSTGTATDPASTPADTATWTIEPTSAPARLDAPPLPVLTALRTGTHPDYARMTVEIGAEAPGPPGYRVEYVDRPLIECGSGNQIFPVGDAWLELRLEPAAAHTEAGQPTLGDREIAVEGPLLLRVYRTCDFEGIVTLVMALASPNPFRVLTLADPWRIVVDVQR